MTDATVNHLLGFQKTGAADSFQEFWAAAEPFVSQAVARQLVKRLVVGPAGGVDEVAVVEITQCVAEKLLELPWKANRAGWFDPARCGGPVDGLRGWLYRIACNKVIDYCRTYRTLGRTELKRVSWHDLELNEGPVASPSEDPRSKFAESELQRIVAACVAELAAGQRQLYQFLFVDRLSQRQCVGKLGISAAGVCRHREKMLATLATKLAARGVDASWCGPAA